MPARFTGTAKQDIRVRRAHRERLDVMVISLSHSIVDCSPLLPPVKALENAGNISSDVQNIGVERILEYSGNISAPVALGYLPAELDI